LTGIKAFLVEKIGLPDPPASSTVRGFARSWMTPKTVMRSKAARRSKMPGCALKGSTEEMAVP